MSAQQPERRRQRTVYTRPPLFCMDWNEPAQLWSATPTCMHSTTTAIVRSGSQGWNRKTSAPMRSVRMPASPPQWCSRSVRLGKLVWLHHSESCLGRYKGSSKSILPGCHRGQPIPCYSCSPGVFVGTAQLGRAPSFSSRVDRRAVRFPMDKGNQRFREQRIPIPLLSAGASRPTYNNSRPVSDRCSLQGVNRCRYLAPASCTPAGPAGEC